jgi:peroxiredoxin family protein
MTLTTERPTDAATNAEVPVPEQTVQPDVDGVVGTKGLVIVNWSGEFDRVLPTLLPFVKDQKRIVGDNWMQKMLSLMQRPGISHLKLSKMNFVGMGPWMIGKLSKQYNVASPAELLEAAQAMGVEFIPCQMTMDMFGLKAEDMIDGLGEPAGAATVIELMTQPGTASLFI